MCVKTVPYGAADSKPSSADSTLDLIVRFFIFVVFSSFVRERHGRRYGNKTSHLSSFHLLLPLPVHSSFPSFHSSPLCPSLFLRFSFFISPFSSPCYTQSTRYFCRPNKFPYHPCPVCPRPLSRIQTPTWPMHRRSPWKRLQMRQAKSVLSVSSFSNIGSRDQQGQGTQPRWCS